MSFSKQLLQWYSENKRILPWRDIVDPYKIWLSEIMLQQTRIQQVYDYFERFINQWSTIQGLANASEEEVFKAWEGLGYYSRARNLHQTAKIITEKYNGKFPETYRELIKLPGIGPYTARAIASFAFQEPVVALDGNGFRVITRFLNIDLPINTTKNQKIIQQKADELLQNVPSKEFNYALMDLGNLICKPVQPLCNQCPLISECNAFLLQNQELRPVKLNTLKRSKDFIIYFWIQKNNQIGILKKNQSYWKGLFTFPYLMVEESEWAKYSEKVLKEIKHVLTHKDLFIKIVKANLVETNPEIEWIPLHELQSKPFPKPLQDFISEVFSVEKIS